jgi:hypothetical protein
MFLALESSLGTDFPESDGIKEVKLLSLPLLQKCGAIYYTR